MSPLPFLYRSKEKKPSYCF